MFEEGGCVGVWKKGCVGRGVWVGVCGWGWKNGVCGWEEGRVGLKLGERERKEERLGRN